MSLQEQISVLPGFTLKQMQFDDTTAVASKNIPTIAKEWRLISVSVVQNTNYLWFQDRAGKCC